MSRQFIALFHPALVLGIAAGACAGDTRGRQTDTPIDDGPTVIASGLNGPMGLLVEEDGTVWVVDSGVGGDQVISTMDPVSRQRAEGTFGETSRIVRVDPAGTRTEVAALPSTFVGGVAYGGGRLAVRDGVLYATSGGWMEGAAEPVHCGIVRVSPGSRVSVVVSTCAFEADHNPDGASRETNPFGLTTGPDGLLWMTDAAGNALYRIDPDSATLELVAVFDPMPGPVPNPTHGGKLVVEAVPTAVEFMQDEAYVAFLPGLPMAPGSSKVVRATGDGVISDYATGLTRITDLKLGPDGRLYAVSMGVPREETPTGSIIRVAAGTASEEILGGLSAPTAIGFDAQGNAYVTVNGVGAPGSGQVVRYPRLVDPKR